MHYRIKANGGSLKEAGKRQNHALKQFTVVQARRNSLAEIEDL